MEPRVPWLVILLLSLYPCLAAAYLDDQALLPALQANVRRDRELLLIGSETKKYLLLGLKPGASYEARVSHPATIPVRLEIQISEQPLTFKIPRRRILDCDKITFHVEPDGSVMGHRQPVLLLAADHLSVHRDGLQGAGRTLIYNVVVQELWLGIPTDTFPVISVILVLLGALLLLLPWWVDTALPRLERYLQGGSTASAAVQPLDPAAPLNQAAFPRAKAS